MFNRGIVVGERRPVNTSEYFDAPVNTSEGELRTTKCS